MADKEIFQLTKLDGTNFPLWEFGITFALQGKGLMEFVKGTAVAPAAAEKLEIYNNKKGLACAYILSSIDKKLHPSLINCTNANEMWNKLESLYGEKTEDDKQNAWEDFYAYKIKVGVDLAIQIEEFERILKRLENAGDKPSDDAVKSKLLNCLPPKYSTFRMAWESTPAAAQTKEALITRLLREDKRLVKSEEEITSSLALQVNEMSLKKDGNKNTSFKKKSKAEKKKFIEELKKRTKCAICKEKGHWARECPNKDDDSKKVEGERSTMTESKSNVSSAYICDYIAMYSRQHDCYTNEDWIADSGATAHMTSRKDFFHTLEPLATKHGVEVANNVIILAAGVGSIRIEEIVDGKMIQRDLKNVLYVPDLRRNLFSVSKVTEHGYSFHAYNQECEIRNPVGKLSSKGVRKNGLFNFPFKVVRPAKEVALTAISSDEKLRL